jgi:ubiquinone/menaquinone biosynthesis C-methylase UbiE
MSTASAVTSDQSLVTPDISLANGNPEVFDAEWREALASGDPRWLSYPAEYPQTQAELLEHVKAQQVMDILADHGITSGRVLEYACGSGGMAAFLANHQFEVVATDVSVNALRLAQRNATLRAVPNEQFTTSVGDIFQLPFADHSFDVVMSYGLLEHFTEEALNRLLAETYRVLRPGGIHIVDIIHGRWSIRTVATIANFIASACAHIISGRSDHLPRLHKAYFQHYFENTLHLVDYARLFHASGLQHVQAYTCRPFPLLAVSGVVERLYLAMLRLALPLWRWFDRTDVPILNTLGWMYLVYGTKPNRSINEEMHKRG